MRNKHSETEAAHEKSVSEEVRTAPQNDHLGYARLLGQIDLFVGLDRVTLAKLAAHLEPQFFRSGSIILRQALHLLADRSVDPITL